jgi:pimeloyl-ACP methyl ester carboxylesterase
VTTHAVQSGDVTLHVDDVGEGAPVVLLHGFPEIAHSWRYQIPALVNAGYRSIAFDQRGCGTASKPEHVDAYRLECLVEDVIAVLDSRGVDAATLVGHDWGSIVMWTTAVLHPDRVQGLVSLNVPYRGACGGFPTTDVIRDQLAQRFSYILRFLDGDAAERDFAADPVKWLKFFYQSAAKDRDFMSDEDFETYLDSFVEGGIMGPVSWYRNIDRNARDFADHLGATIEQPTLLIAADADPVLPLSLIDGMERWVPDLTTVVIEDCGHWTQQERPDTVNAELLMWLGARN